MPIDTYELKEECYQEKSQSAEMLAEWQTLDLRQIPKCWAEWEMTKALEGNSDVFTDFWPKLKAQNTATFHRKELCLSSTCKHYYSPSFIL